MKLHQQVSGGGAQEESLAWHMMDDNEIDSGVRSSEIHEQHMVDQNQQHVMQIHMNK